MSEATSAASEAGAAQEPHLEPNGDNMTTVTVAFGTSQRTNEDIPAALIGEQKRARETDGTPVCAIVTIQGSGLDVRLPVGQCGSGGGGRGPNEAERRV